MLVVKSGTLEAKFDHAFSTQFFRPFLQASC